MNIKIIFWKRIRDLRKKQGLSQEKLAEKCKLHRTYIWIIERWEKIVSLENTEILAHALEVDLQDLFLKL